MAASICGHALAQVAPATSSDVRILDEIIVTARRREESLQDVPLSVTAVTGLELERSGIDSFDEVLSLIPNAGQAGGIAGTLQGLVSIRGISTLVRFVGVESSVGYYVDGIYMARPETFNQELHDIERVEVLRGPQGALFGKNTIAGAINIVTKQPAQIFVSDFEAQYGNYDLARIRGTVSGPLPHQSLSASLTAAHVDRDGYVRNVSGNGPDLETARLTTFRGKLRYQPSSRIDAVLSLTGLIDRGKPAFFEVADVSFFQDPSEETPFTVNQDQPNFLDRDIWGLSLNIDVHAGPGVSTTVVGYQDSSFSAGLDDDKVPVRYFADFFSSSTRSLSLESRYAAAISARLDYLLGVYYLDQDASNDSHFALGDFLTGVPGLEPPIDLTSFVDTRSLAAFANASYELTSKLTLEIGGRYLQEKKRAVHRQVDMTGIFGSTDFAAVRRDADFAPTVSLSQQFQDDFLGYVRYSQGFKSAGFSTDFVVAGTTNLHVAPEHATAYEIGIKHSRPDGKARLNVAAFHTEYDDLQVSQIVGGGVTLSNAARAEVCGVEAELNALLGRHFDLTGSVGYLHATYDNFPDCPVPGAQTSPAKTNCAGSYLNLAPRWTGALGIQFTHPIGDLGNFIARTDWNFRAKVFFEPQNSLRLSGKERHLLNLRVGYVTESWEIIGWVENVTDEVYVNFADDRSVIAVNTTQAFGPPRMYGITAKYKIGGD